ncbi:hypothetical protein [Tenggerimyces flavus]|uniref:Uncharacterized protein n=1 Tax=Tenggerimyces flavus TaxID=1708749 RepID=A0ABV7Y7K9_9ACTN|nr:hypothetical protein [Tenggerimyces flavus]MBM7785686.1 hypothetical protein [Tenggerimyces flavus]
MNRLEDRVREALDDQASTRRVDLDALWRATEPQLRRRSTARPVLLGLAAASVAVAGAFGVHALTRPAPTITPAATPSLPAPAPTDVHPSPNPSLELWPDARGRLTTREAEEVFRAARRIDDLGDGQFVPIDVVAGTDGSRWALGAYRVAADAPRNVSGKPMLCYHTLWLSGGPENPGEGAGCSGTTLPQPDDPGNATLTSTHALNLPVDGDGDHVETGQEFYAGRAATTVHRVVGIDAKGKRYEGVVAGWTLDWELRQYFIVTKTEVTLTKVEAYDEDGRLLTTVPSPH